MSAYDELVYEARRLGQAEIVNSLRTLARDKRFVGVVAWIEGNKEAFAQASSAQALAGDAGKLAHAAGSHHALRVLEGQLRTAVEPARKPVQPAEPSGTD